MLHSDDDRLCQFDGCLLAKAFVGSRKGYSCPAGSVEKALCEPERIRLCHVFCMRTKQEHGKSGCDAAGMAPDNFSTLCDPRLTRISVSDIEQTPQRGEIYYDTRI